MREISGWQILVLVAVVVLLFGASRLPAVAKSLGQSMKVFKNEMKDLRDDGQDTKDATDSNDAAEPTKPGDGPKA